MASEGAEGHMASEGAVEMVGGFGDAAGGVRVERQERGETSRARDSSFLSQDRIPDLPASPETAGRLTPRTPTSSFWAARSRASGQGTGAPLHPPRLAVGGWRDNVEPRRPERRAASTTSGRITHGVEQEQNSQPQSRSDCLEHIDEKWPEVMFINDYAVFIGYLSMAVMGTGFLVLTWSTVVLLGGFVTMLAKKDFWCLTVITLVQTRIFDVFLNRNISYLGYSFKRLWKAALSIALPQNPFRKWCGCGLIRVLVFTIVLCPLFALYTFGLFVSPVISLWRLLQQDYGDIAGDISKANLKPALVVLYSLALLQGMLFCYKAISSLEEHRLLKLVALAYGLDEDDKARGSISDYLREIRVGCEKDPSSARGRNLVTYAAGLMQSNSPNSYLSGARIIDTLIRLPKSMEENRHRVMNRVGSALSPSSGDDAMVRDVARFFRSRVSESVVESQRMLMNNMIGSASSGAIKKFVQMLDSRSQSDSAEIRLRAMRIVEHFASEIRVSKIPYAIQCISSFLSNSNASHHEHKETSISLLWRLTDDEENLRLMSNTNGLTLKIIEVLEDSFRELHHSEHDRWCLKIAVPGMVIIKRLTSVMTRSNNMQLPREILESTNAISTLESMLNCQQCKVVEELQESVLMVLTQITSVGTSLPVGGEVKRRLVLSLLASFVGGNSSVKRLALESLKQLSSENSDTIVGAEDGCLAESLTQAVLAENSEYRKRAADILKNLFDNYTTEEGHGLQKLKDAMIDDVIPKVLREVLGCRPRAESMLPCPSPYPSFPAYNPGYPDNLFSLENSYNVEEQEALVRLCATVYKRLCEDDPDSVARLDQKAKEMSLGWHRNFDDLLREAVEVVRASKIASAAWTAGPAAMLFSNENHNTCCIS